MAYNGSEWDEANPTNSTLANEIDDIAVDIKKGVRSRMANEHIWPASQTGTNAAGFHTTVSLQTQTGAPSIPVVNSTTQAGVVYASSGFAGLLLYRGLDGVTRTLGYPTGVVSPFSGTTTHPGTYFCTGGAFSRVTDTALFAVIGTLYGTGDGATTFNIPDMRDRVPLGKGTTFATIAATTGSTTHTLVIAEMPAHTHVYTAATAAAGASPGSGETQSWGNYNTTTVGGGGAHNIMQPSLVVNYLIGR